MPESDSRARSVLAIVRLTSARPSGGRPAVPAKMTSSILPPRRLLAPCSPITQLSASTTLDFPEPFGPTTQVMPGSSRSVVADANDLKPRSVRVFRCTTAGSSPGWRTDDGPARRRQVPWRLPPGASGPGALEAVVNWSLHLPHGEDEEGAGGRGAGAWKTRAARRG